MHAIVFTLHLDKKLRLLGASLNHKAIFSTKRQNAPIKKQNKNDDIHLDNIGGKWKASTSFRT